MYILTYGLVYCLHYREEACHTIDYMIMIVALWVVFKWDLLVYSFEILHFYAGMTIHMFFIEPTIMDRTFCHCLNMALWVRFNPTHALVNRKL